MSSLVAPRFELPLVDQKGRISREWYKFLVQVGTSLNSSTSSYEDAITVAETEVADPPIQLAFENVGTSVGSDVRTVNFDAGMGTTLTATTLTVASNYNVMAWLDM